MGGRYGIFSEILEPRLEEIIREENIESIANLMDGRLNTLGRRDSRQTPAKKPP